MSSDRLCVVGGRAVRGRLTMPGDKSVSHRALLMAALAPGRSTVDGLSDGDDVARTRAAIEALGADVAGTDGVTQVIGGSLHEPDHVIDVGNSGTTLRLLAGVVAAQPFLTVITGDASVSSRPVDRVVEPLGRMGARVDARLDSTRPPLVIRGGGLQGIDYEPAVASAQVKSAVLLAGLAARGDTTVRETLPTRVHTEEMLSEFGASITVEAGLIRLRPGPLEPTHVVVPGDPSHAAFWVVAACIVPGSDLTIDDLYLGPGRRGFLDVLARMGADLEVDTATGSVRVRASELGATTVEAHEVPGLVDEIPALAVAASRAEGTTRFDGVGELKVKETDRLAAITTQLSRLGARVEGDGDTLTIVGGARLVGTTVRADGDHRMAMALAVAGLAAEGETVVQGWSAVATSYPGFEEDLARCE